MLNDNQDITVDATARTYTKVWDQEFAKEIADGTTTVRKAPITNGNSILKISHSETKGVERHLVFVRDKMTIEGVSCQEQAYLVVTCAADDPASKARAVNIALGLGAKVAEANFLPSVLDGQS